MCDCKPRFFHSDDACLCVSLRGPGLGQSRVLAWRLSNTLTTDFCIEAVQEALASRGTQDIFNTDQDC